MWLQVTYKTANTTLCSLKFSIHNIDMETMLRQHVEYCHMTTCHKEHLTEYQMYTTLTWSNLLGSAPPLRRSCTVL